MLRVAEYPFVPYTPYRLPYLLLYSLARAKVASEPAAAHTRTTDTASPHTARAGAPTGTAASRPGHSDRRKPNTERPGSVHGFTPPPRTGSARMRQWQCTVQAAGMRAPLFFFDLSPLAF